MSVPNLLAINTNRQKSGVQCAQNSKGLTSRSDTKVLHGAIIYDDANESLLHSLPAHISLHHAVIKVSPVVCMLGSTVSSMHDRL